MILSITPKQKIYLTAFGFLAGFVLAWLFVISPLVNQIRADGRELAQKKKEIESFYRDWQALEENKRSFREIQKELAGQSAFLPAQEPLKFIEYAESAAQQTGNHQDIAVVPADKDAPAGQLAFRLTTQGSFPNLIKFLIYLENAPYYNSVQALQIRRVSQREADMIGAAGRLGDVSSTVELSVYQQ